MQWEGGPPTPGWKESIQACRAVSPTACGFIAADDAGQTRSVTTCLLANGGCRWRKGANPG